VYANLTATIKRISAAINTRHRLVPCASVFSCAAPAGYQFSAPGAWRAAPGNYSEGTEYEG
jgi:hypothetical protein